MSGATTAIVGAVAAVAASQLVKSPKSPDAPRIEDAPQKSKQPDERARRQASTSPGQTGIPSAAGTMLTGASGVAPGSLNIGQSTLLGQ